MTNAITPLLFEMGQAGASKTLYTGLRYLQDCECRLKSGLRFLLT